MRGVTALRDYQNDLLYISTHTPHARRDITNVNDLNDLNISTHTPHARRDVIRRLSARPHKHFYSHASCEA